MSLSPDDINKLAEAIKQGVRTPDDKKEKEKALKEKLDTTLANKNQITVPFPPCSDVMLALYKFEYETVGTGAEQTLAPKDSGDELLQIFKDYFGFNFGKFSARPKSVKANNHEIIQQSNLNAAIDEGWGGEPWPPTWCLPASYVTLKGKRHFYAPSIDKNVKRLFIGDVVWLFFMERMGLFQINGKILDHFALSGRYPISNGFEESDPQNINLKDDITALALEAMTRQMEMGTGSKVRDRNVLYRTTLGWVQENGRNLNLETNVNTAFNNLFHKFIYLALEYFKEERLKFAIQGASSNNGNSSGATLVTIRSTMNLLKKSFENFMYGRNYFNTLSGIVWTVASLGLIKNIRQSIGIPEQYNSPHEYIPLFFSKLVENNPQSAPSETNRFDTHFECAANARDILIDIELMDSSATGSSDSEIESWLSIIETKVEGYRTAYHAMTKVDLGTTQNPVIEQQV